MESIGLWLLSIFAGLKALGSLQYMGGAAKFFLIIEFNYVIICINLCRYVESLHHYVGVRHKLRG